MLEKELLEAIIDVCDVQSIPDDFPLDAPIVGPDSQLGLDSLDALEIVVMVQENYGVRIQGQKQGQEILANLKSLADYIRSKSTQEAV